MFLGVRKESSGDWVWSETRTYADDVVLVIDDSYECAALYTDEFDSNIVATPCDIHMHFICEFDLNAEESEDGSSTGKVIGTFFIR